MANIRDPIHGFIDIEPLSGVLDCRVMQRLRRIRQLARADLVYPGLMHSRFEHSLGVLHVASEMFGRLGLAEQEDVLRAAALLHDVGHGPFSHVFEGVTGYDHEMATRRIILEDSELDTALGKAGVDAKDVIGILEKNDLLHYIISSPLDADKIDYLQRDSYHTGVAYGVFDYNLLLHTLTAIEDPRGKYLGLTEKGIQNAMSFVLARHLMHVQVYRHHVRRITDAMLLRGIEYARQDGILPAGLFDVHASDFLVCHRQYDDEAVCHRALESQGRSKVIFEALRDRRLFKRAFDLPIDESIDAPRRRRLEKLRDDGAGRLGLERRIAESSKTDPERIIIDVMRAKNPLSPHVSDENEIMIKMDDGSIRNLTEVLPFQSTRPITMDLLVICPGACRETVGEAARKVLADF